MSASQDEDERRRRSFEAGREMLEKYKAKRSSKDKNTNVLRVEQSDDESLPNEESIAYRSDGNGGVLSRDITQSSFSISEGEADADLEGLAGRVAELEELLEGKEAMVGALTVEIDNLRAETSSPNSSQSQSSSGKDVISLYCAKLQEFEKAVLERDNLIEHLTSSLEQALSARDALIAQLNSLNSMQITNFALNDMNLQQKINSLETTMNDQEALIQRLNTQLMDIHKHVQTLEMERETRNAEISDYKMQINNLNEQIRLSAAEKNLNIDKTLEQQKQYEVRVDKIKQDMQHILDKFTTVTNANAIRHQEELKDLTVTNETEIASIRGKYEESMKTLKEENRIFADRLNKELPNLESTHAKELSVFQTQLSSYKKTVEALKLELVNRTESQKVAQSQVQLLKTKYDELQCTAKNELHIAELNFQKDKELLLEQIKLHKIQLEDIASKHIATMSILESKESIERSLEQALTNVATLKQENDTLKFKLVDLSCRFSTAQTTLEDSQGHERTLSSKIELEKSLSRTSVSTTSEFYESMYKTFDEDVIQNQLASRKLAENIEIEKMLINKVRCLEEDILKANNELEQADLAKKAYEKQLKDMKNMYDKLHQEVNLLNKSSCMTTRDVSTQSDSENALILMNVENNSVQQIENQEKEIESLKLLVEQKETENANCKKDLVEMIEKTKNLEEQCQELKNGLTNAWAQCAEFEEKLNQTLNDSRKSNVSVSSTTKHFEEKEKDDNQSSMHQRLFSQPDNAVINISDDDFLKNDNEDLCKELQQLLEGEASLDEVKYKLRRYYALCEKIATGKAQFSIQNVILPKQKECGSSIQKPLDELCTEKESLSQEIEHALDRRKEELETMKTNSTKEIKRLHLLLQKLKDGDASLNELKVELEARHAKEMEELRTYFEGKCLQMEKQYSEEIFSQQSKRISENDSETEELTDDLYFGGAGDCLNASNSRTVTPSAIEESSKTKILDTEKLIQSEADYENNIKALQQELEHKVGEIQNIKTSYKKTIEEQKVLYECQIRDIEAKLERPLVPATVHQYCQTEWEALENGELSNLRDAYNHQLEEQIALARQDIIDALQEQFQVLLTVESDKEDNWPVELLELRDKFTCNAKQEIQELKKMHCAELTRLSNEHDCITTKMIEEHQKEINCLKMKIHNIGKEQEVSYVEISGNNIIEERDNLQKTCITLKSLIGELVNYFIMCEEEVNNTLISEVLKRQLSGSVIINEKNFYKDDNIILSEIQSKDSPNPSIKRVHFAPQSNKLTSIVNSDNKTLQMIDEDANEKLKRELKVCLRRLKSDSTEILNVSSLSAYNKTTSPANEPYLTNKINEVNMKLNHAETLIMRYQEEAEQLKLHILELQQKLINAENKKEIITEGYGESDLSRDDITVQDPSQVQEKARHVLSNGGGDTSYLLQLIEELCKQHDKLVDDVKKEKEDLQQQIEAADKQLRATRRFLDEQASEREVERDEAAKQILLLQEQLKEREREKERDMRISNESELSPDTSDTSSNVAELQTTDYNTAVEALESEMREMSSLMSDTQAKKSEKESELKAAIDKIFVLREIIADLEQQLQIKSEREEFLEVQITQLETVITAQTKHQQELIHELDAIKTGSENRQMSEQINHLQEELLKHKLSSEHFNVNSSVLKQIKAELYEMQNQLDKRIQELESAHMCASNLSLSQPSEDVSIREQIDAARCLTPDDPSSPPMLPLDQVLKLKDKILKHARAEEVMFKRIKDLEMQLTTIKNQNEELLAEQEILQQTASEQLYQIETMRGRLEHHKQNAPFAQKQATSRLELQLHEATTKYHSLEQTVADKEIELKETKTQLERANQILTEKEIEMQNLVQVENGVLQDLKDQLKFAEEEKKTLQIKLGAHEHNQLELPQLIDTILADKNEEIDHLKEQLSKKEKQLNIYSSAFDNVQLKDLPKQMEPKTSARTLSDILSINSECEEPSEAIRNPNATHITSHNISSFKIPTCTSKNTLSTNSLLHAENVEAYVPPLDLESHTHSFNNSVHHSDMELQHTEDESKVSSPQNDISEDSPRIEKLLTKRVQEIEALLIQVKLLEEELESKSYLANKRESELISLEQHYRDVQKEFTDTIDNLTKDRNFYMCQYELVQASENKIKKDLQETENILKLKSEELENHKDRMQANEKIITEINTENTKLKKVMKIMGTDELRQNNLLLQERTGEIEKLKELILEKNTTLETLQMRIAEIETENKELNDFKIKVHTYEKEMANLQEEVQRLTDNLNNRDQMICKLEEMAKQTYNSQSGASSPSSSSCKDQEIHHLQEFLKEKDKVIRQMSDDSKSLHRALETIQNKMKESGNIVELRKKLKDERKLNMELKDIVIQLQEDLKNVKKTSTSRSQNDNDIEDMVNDELNLSAQLEDHIMEFIKDDVADGKVTMAEITQDHQQKLDQVCKENEILKKEQEDYNVKENIMRNQIDSFKDRILQLQWDLDQEKKLVVKLHKNVEKERLSWHTMKEQLEVQSSTAESNRIQDHELINILQKKLYTAIEKEGALTKELLLLKEQYAKMEQCTEGKSNENPLQQSVISPERLESLKQEINQLRESNKQLKEENKSLTTQMNSILEEIEFLNGQRDKLINNLSLEHQYKRLIETNIETNTKELYIREKECDYLRKQIQLFTETENKKRRQRNFELEEMEKLRNNATVAEKARAHLENEIEHAKQELKRFSDRELKFARKVESLKEREAELNMKLALSRERERKMQELIDDLQPTLKTVIEKEENRELKNELNTNDTVSLLQKIKELVETVEKYAAEKNNLQDKISRMREDKESLMQHKKMLEGQIKELKSALSSKQQTVSIDRLQSFYGKYLRMESRRKALAYQKKYLLCVVGSYQYCEENTLCVLAQLTEDQRSYTRLEHNKKRWQTGKRVGANALMSNINQLIDLPPIKRTTSNYSPPVRERATTIGRTGWRSDFTIEQYYQQVRNFQEVLDSAIAESGTSHINSD